ncbi:hypothetical protein COJ87_19490 [Bacillus cereus]|nr:hypothetical protein COM76_28485 [Bacillus cereus]PGA42825.1 hypothetical protein COL88_28690 [Bacillus thuringiensis]PET61626.1 hypothetical protein CN522_21150 [Bacillus cereus]PEU54083.1 hypothetical protein CN414_18460 [Bacillus cereus]PEX69594.1 hypothetical protein CN457_30855 [Bacillus cereus]
MLFEALNVAQIDIVRLGNAISIVIRCDLSSMFTRLIAETGLYLDEGLRLIIDKN